MDWMGHRFPESGQQELARWKRGTHCSEGGASQESPEKRENRTHMESAVAGANAGKGPKRSWTGERPTGGSAP